MENNNFETIRTMTAEVFARYDVVADQYRDRIVGDSEYLSARAQRTAAIAVFDFAFALVAHGQEHAAEHFGDTVRGFGGIQI
jgi:hypothetical protein